VKVSTLQCHFCICSCVNPSTLFSLGNPYNSISGLSANISGKSLNKSSDSNSSASKNTIISFEQCFFKLFLNVAKSLFNGNSIYDIPNLNNKSLTSWAAVKAKDGKPDMTTKVEFEQNDFCNALSYVGYFSNIGEAN